MCSRSPSEKSTNHRTGTCHTAVRIHGLASGLRSAHRSWSATACPRTTGGSTASSTGAGNISASSPSASQPRSRVRQGQTHTTPFSSATNASPLSWAGTPTGGVAAKSASERRSSSWAVGRRARPA